jgi:hypothetical protein
MFTTLAAAKAAFHAEQLARQSAKGRTVHPVVIAALTKGQR